jgi:protein arginine N-methyltransferase 5
LYEEIFYGILPERHSPGLISWFPLFFPLRNPITVLAGDKITAHVWRRSSSTKVWYEWAVSTPQRSGIVNPNGRSYWIGKFP